MSPSIQQQSTSRDPSRDHLDDLLGVPRAEGEARRAGLAIGRAMINGPELELTVAAEREYNNQVDGVMFTDEAGVLLNPEDFAAEHFGGVLPDRDAVESLIALRRAEIAEKWSPAIELARALGPDLTTEEFRAMCAIENVEIPS